MNEHYGLKPEDFRHAWTHAYQNAVHQIVIMQETSQQQMAFANAQVICSRQAVLDTTADLRLVQGEIIENIQKATKKSTAQIQLATDALARQTRDFSDTNQKLHRDYLSRKRLLDDGRRELDALAMKLKGGNLRSRLVAALFPKL